MADTEDRRTDRIVENTRQVAAITKLPEWKLLKGELIGRATEMAWVLDVDLSAPDALVDMRARQKAFRVILEWLFDLEGAELTDELLSKTMTETKDDYIRNLAG